MTNLKDSLPQCSSVVLLKMLVYESTDDSECAESLYAVWCRGMTNRLVRIQQTCILNLTIAMKIVEAVKGSEICWINANGVNEMNEVAG